MSIGRFEIVLLTMVAVVPCSIVSVGFGQEAGKRVNVKEFRAKGDGVADDSAAIQKAINAAPDGSTIFFPAGTYNVSNLQVNKRSGLSFTGEGKNSLVKQKTGAPRIATFNGSRDIVIQNLSFDANGINSYGGLVFYAATGVRIENNSFVDSAPKHNRAGDHYSFVFGKGAQPSRDIRITNNTIEFLQLEVDHSKNVVIEGNTVKGAIGTSGIGIFTVGNDAIAEDYLIKGNTVIDPPSAGFHAVTDPPSSRNCVFRRITIIDNRVIRTKTRGYGVRIGTLNNSQPATGNVFEDIVVKDNRIRIEPTAPAAHPMIFANASATAGIVFERLLVTGNTIENEGPRNSGYAIDLKRIQNSLVADNTVKGVASGISLAGDLLGNRIHNNSVEASDIAYKVEGSLGRNRAATNRIVGSPKAGWKISGLKASDSMEVKD